MTILEAAAAGVPVVARRTPAMEALGIQPLFDQVSGLLDLIADFPSGPAIALARRCGEELRRTHSRSTQSRALEAVYGRALAART
jgi:glycosyltransferase involved in cell wall biosynthesis